MPPLSGFLLLVLAVFDLTFLLLGSSLTGVLWSPAIFFVLGLLFCILQAPQDGRRPF